MCLPNDPSRGGPQGDETAMKRTISIVLSNRFNDAERVIGLFSSTGYKIEKMNLSVVCNQDLSKLVIVTDSADKDVGNLLIRLKQQVRVTSVECIDGDKLPDRRVKYSTL
jgi:acetolactate synthase small subunit